MQDQEVPGYEEEQRRAMVSERQCRMGKAGVRGSGHLTKPAASGQQ